MKIFKIAILCFCFLSGKHLQANELVCPDKTKGEVSEDCPWALQTKQVISEKKTLQSLLSETPFWSMLKKDATNQAYQNFWGKSVNFDEQAKEVIIHPLIINELKKIFNQGSSEEKILHAGLQHTYGYLFSNLLTPYGYKRARWVKNELEEGFGLSANTLGPRPQEGTFFSNVTYFFKRLISEDSIEALHVAKELVKFDYKKLKIETLEERTEGHLLRTDIIYYSKKDGALLLYSADNKIISGFPITLEFAKKIFDPKYLGENQKIKIRYNAWVDGLSNKGDNFVGQRIKK